MLTRLLTWFQGRQWRPLSLGTPGLRLYQQLLLLVLGAILIPLGSASVVIYKLNQNALKKELNRFTQQLAGAIYEDLITEMAWQQRHFSLLRDMVALQKQPLQQTAQQVFLLDGELTAIGWYDALGERTTYFYKDIGSLSPELRLPTALSADTMDAQPAKEDKKLSATSVSKALALRQPQYEVVYASSLAPVDSGSYQLRAILPIGSSGAPGVKNAAYLVLQREFGFLGQMLAKHRQGVSDMAYLVDAYGEIIAGPRGATPYHYQLSKKDFALLQASKPGVATLVKTNVSRGWQPIEAGKRATPEALPDALDKAEAHSPAPLWLPRWWPEELRLDEDEEQALETVFVKIPAIDWGLILESPYHIRQTYIKRARVQAIIVIGVCLLVVLALAAIYLYGIIRNFRQLIKGIKAMAKGNYARKIRLIANYATPYEIVYLSGEWNRMARRISQAWSQVQTLNQELLVRNDQLAELDTLKSNLIDTVSHELRTPLTHIKGYASRLLRYEGRLDEETRRNSLRIIKQQADRLSRLVEDLLVIPDLENNTLRVYVDQVNLNEVLERCLIFYHERSNVPILTHWGEHLQEQACLVQADPDRLEQVLINLLDNAIKYNEGDAPLHLQISQEPTLEGGFLVRVTVKNQCLPIAPTVLPQLFEKFKRLDDGLTRTTRGSGLGLFITRNLVEAMGGSILLEYQEPYFIASITLNPLGDKAFSR